MRQLADAIKSQAGAAGAWVYDATVDAVDAARGTVSVTVQPAGFQVEGLVYHTPLPRGKWKLIALPAVDASVKVVTTDPELINADTAYVIGGTWDEDDTPPAGGAAGEFLLVHQDGQKFHLKADGSIEVFSGTIKLGDGGATALCREEVHQFITGSLATWLANHIHPDPVSGVSGPPSSPPPALTGGLTTKVKGS